MKVVECGVKSSDYTHSEKAMKKNEQRNAREIHKFLHEDLHMDSYN